MTTLIEIDGKYYSFEELSDEQKELYRDDFAEIERLHGQSAPTPTLVNKALAYIYLVVIMGVTGLAFLSFFSDVNTTIELNSVWKSVWIVTTLAVLGLISSPFIIGKAEISFEDGPLIKAGMFLAGLLGLCVLSFFASLSGIPTVLHYLTAKDGEVTVTVIDKEDSYTKTECRPRLIIEEFSWFGSDHICPGQEVYEKIDVGSHIILSGKVSKYGIEPSQIRWGGNG